MATFTTTKDPDAELDYTIDWSQWLVSGDTISTSTWTVPAGLTQGTNGTSNTTTTATIWITGGTVATPYDLRNRIVTAGGRTDDRTIRFTIQEK